MKNDTKDILDGLNDKLNGIYRGVIEDNSSDPLKMGRCKIRIFGVHSPNKVKTSTDGIPTNELPWAEPVFGLFEGSISGYGAWTVPQQGSHVFVFFENGHILNPRYFASVPGFPTDKNHGLENTQGFSDPDKRLPDKLNEPDFNRLARNEKTGSTLLATKTSNKTSNISTADGGSWSEPSLYNAQYPNNKVFQSKSGITIEIDDTNGNERIHVYHPSNSYIEIGNDGKIIVKNASDKFEIVGGDKNEYVQGSKNETIDSNKTNKIGGKSTTDISGLEEKFVHGNKNTETDGQVNSTAGTTMNLEAGSVLTLQGGAVIIRNASGTTIMNLNSSGSSEITATDLTINSTGGVTINDDLHVNGNITNTGSNPDNHTHP